MKDYAIISDSTCDLTDDLAREWNVEIQPMIFRIKNKEYRNYLDERELPLKNFYNMMREGEVATTAQVNVIDAINFFRPFLEQGKDILCIAFSSGLSGSVNSIRLAKSTLEEDFPERKIMIVDSLCASAGEGLLVNRAVLNRKNNLSVEDNAKDLETFKFRIKHWFTVDDIDTLRRGGRLSNSKALVAKVLNIKPVLNVDNEGHLQAVYKKVGRKVALRTLVECALKGYATDDNYITLISHADAYEDALFVKGLLEKVYQENNIKSEIYISSIGPVIGAHAGPGTIALFTVGDKR